jgi:hypothetical protein
VTLTDNHILARLSSDLFGISMSLVVHEISSMNQSCPRASDLAAQPWNESQSFTTCSTLPYGYNNNIEQLKWKCSEYVNTVSEYPLNSVETVIGDTSGIIWEALRAIQRFKQANTTAKKASTTFVMSPFRRTVGADFSEKCFSGAKYAMELRG